MTERQNSQVIPLSLMQWATDEWVSRFFEDSALRPASMLDIDPNRPLSKLGSRMLHLAAMSPDKPTKEVTAEVTRFLLVERRADPNVPDNYGRTPLTLFVTQGGRFWTEDDDYGCGVVSLLFEHGADANVFFAPNFVDLAGCEKWTLAHHLNDEHHGGSGWPMPLRMRQLLESHLDRSLCDSVGRAAEFRQLPLAI
jgi:hypothetical protein